MAGGFGAVVMLFLIINHSIVDSTEDIPLPDMSEVRLLDWQLEQGEIDRTRLQEIIDILTIKIADTKKEIEQIEKEIKERLEEVEEIERVSLDQSKTLEQLLRELEEKQEELKNLQARADANAGAATLDITGDGDRQYLTGLFMGGNYILIALDASSSMLEQSIVNIIRRRNMSLEKQLSAPKWVRAVDTVEWLTANIPLTSHFQIVLYNEDSEFVVGDGDWHIATDGQAISDAIASLRETAPKKGTNLVQLFETVSDMDPLPDNIHLITDGLPTKDNRNRRRTTITGRERERLFLSAVRTLPAGITVNVVLFPLEGDHLASGWYWYLSHVTGGTYLAPSKDWP